MEKPILFSRELVRAIIEGRKTQTRRVIKPQPDCYHHWEILKGYHYDIKILKTADVCCARFQHTIPQNQERAEWITCPYSEVGGKLWVRESFSVYRHPTDPMIFYKADHKYDGTLKWKPSIHMPRKFSRITLGVKEIRVERLQDISEEDAEKEGVKPYMAPSEMPAYKPAFADLWDKINEKRGYGWDKNPWVWVVSFERI